MNLEGLGVFLGGTRDGGLPAFVLGIGVIVPMESLSGFLGSLEAAQLAHLAQSCGLLINPGNIHSVSFSHFSVSFCLTD
ncbi:hypothetical protein LB528_23055 [Mesorhizobium sp. CA4]|nr:hypothetical protein [Mesorhizobium sp. CA4]